AYGSPRRRQREAARRRVLPAHDHARLDLPREGRGARLEDQAGEVPAGGTLSGSFLHTTYEYTRSPRMAAASRTNTPTSCARWRKNAHVMSRRPHAMRTQPPARCVRVHDSLLVSVHGVRMPTNQLGRILPSRFPRTMRSAPVRRGTIVVMSTCRP